MKIESKKFNEFNHLRKKDAEDVVLDEGDWKFHKEIWAGNKATVVILCGDRHWKMSRTEWAKLFALRDINSPSGEIENDV